MKVQHYNLRGKISGDAQRQIQSLVEVVEAMEAPLPRLNVNGVAVSALNSAQVQDIVGLIGAFAQAPIGTTVVDPLLQQIPTSSTAVTSITAATGITLAPNPIVATGSVAIANTSVVAGSYTYGSFTVDAQGRLTAAANGTGTSAWANWTPVWTNLTVGDGIVTAKFSQIGKVVNARLSLKFGSTTAITGTDVAFTLPVASVTYDGTATIQQLGGGSILDAAPPTAFMAVVMWNTTTTALVRSIFPSSVFIANAALTATAPWTWAVNDEINATFSYEAA